MASNNDFYVKFGSNAATFGKELDNDLAGARRVIGVFSKQLVDLEGNARTRRAAISKELAGLSAEASEVEKRVAKLASESSAAGVDPNVADVHRISQEITNELGGMLTAIETAVRALRGFAGATDETTVRRNRSEGATRAAQGRQVGPDGRILGAGQTGRPMVLSRAEITAAAAQAFAAAQRTQRPAAPAAGTGTGRPVVISSIPSATIDDASFDRVVKAVQDNVKATEKVEASVDRIAAVLASGGRGVDVPEAEAGEAGLTQLARLTKEQNRELFRAFRTALQRVEDTAGPDARRDLWKQIVGNQQTALAAGRSIITPEMRAEMDAPRGPNRRQTKLDEAIAKDTARAVELRSEIEQLSGEMQEGTRTSEGLGRALAELDAVERRLQSNTKARVADETRAQQAERQRRAAVREAAVLAGQTDTAEERRRKQDIRGQLELAADPARLEAERGRGATPRLQRVAETLTAQGYPVDLGGTRANGVTRLSQDELIKRVAAAGAAYVSAGRATADDLRPRRVEGTSEASPDAQRLLREGSQVARLNRQFVEGMTAGGMTPEDAYRILGQDVRSGGQGSRADQRRGRREVGAAIGDEGREAVSEAARVREEFNRARQEAARADAQALLRRDPGFNPYTQDVRVEGRGEQAKAERRAVSSILRAVREIDDFARQLSKLDREAIAAGRAYQSATGAMQRLTDTAKKSGQPIPEDARQEAQARISETYTRLQSAIEARAQERASQPDISRLIDTPEFREGFRQREQSVFIDRQGRSTSYDEARREYEGRRDTERFLNRDALRGSTFQALAGARTFATNEGNTRDFISRMLPGLRVEGDRLGYTDPDRMRDASRPMAGPMAGNVQGPLTKAQAEAVAKQSQAAATNVQALRRMNSGINGYVTHLSSLIDDIEDGETNEERLNATREKVIASLNKLLSAYATAFPGQPTTGEGGLLDERLLLPGEYFGRERGQLVDRTDAGVARGERVDRAQAGRDAMEAEAKTAFQDPKRAEQLQAEILKSLRRRIRALNEDLKELYAVRSSQGAERGGLTKSLNKALGPRLREDIKQAEEILAGYERKLSKGGSLTEAEQKSQAVQQGRINDAYTASPMIMELKARRDALDALRAETAARIRLTESEREAARGERKRVSGRIDAGDIERARADLDAGRVGGRGGTTLEQAQRTLATYTERAANARKRLADLETRIAGALPADTRAAYQGQQAERGNIEAEIARLRASGDLTADTDAADPSAAARRDRAGDELTKLTRRLEGVNRALREMERYAGALNPNLRGSGSVQSRTDVDLSDARREAASAAGVEAQQRARVEDVQQRLVQAQADYDAMVAGFRAQQERRGGKAARNPDVPEFTGGGAGGTGGTGGTGSADAEGPRGGRVGILQQILAALNRIDNRLKGTIKVSGNVKTTEGTRTPRVDADGNPVARQRPDRPSAPRSTPQGRADFFADAGERLPAVRQFIDLESTADRTAASVNAAVDLIATNTMSETRVFRLFRDELNQDAEAAKRFAAAVRAAEGDRRLRSSQAAAAARREQEEDKFLRPRDASGTATGPAYRTRDGSERVTRSSAQAEMKEALRVRQQQERATRRASSEERTAAINARQHAEAVSKLSQETRRAIAELERQNRALNETTAGSDQAAAAEARLAEQMTRVYGLAARDMQVSATQTNQTVGRIYQGAGIDTTSAEVTAARNAARGLGYEVDRSAAQSVPPGGLFGEQSAFTRAMFGNAGFWSRVMGSTGQFIVRNFTAGFVFGLTNALQDVISEAILTEATFIRVSHALEATGRSAGSLRGDLQAISTEYGTSLNDVYTVAAGLTGLFKTPQEIAGATEVVSQLEMISGGALNAQEAMGALASIQGAFGEELGAGVDGLTHVADVLTSVQNSLGTNVEVTAEGVGRMSGLAQQLGLSFEEVAVYSAQIAKLTNQTGAAAGEQFSRILSVMQTGRGRSVLQDALSEFEVVDQNGQKTGEVRQTNIASELGGRDFSAVLTTLSSNWDDLSKEQQQNIAVTIAGQRQAASFAALMNNGAQSLESITRAQNSHGAAQERTTALMKTLNGQISILGSNFQNLANNLVRSGILEWMGALLIATNFVLRGFNNFFSAINDLVDNTPFLGTIAKWSFALLGLLLVIKLMQRSWMGLRATLAQNANAQAFTQGFRAPERLDRNGYPASLGYGPATNPVRDRAGAAFNRFTGGPSTTATRVGDPGYRAFARTGQRDFQTGALARGFGAGLDRAFGRPLDRAAGGLTTFGNALQARAAQVRQVPLPMQTGTAQAAALQAAADRRAGRLDLAGRIFSGNQSRTGATPGMFGGGIAGLISGATAGIRNFGTNEGVLRRTSDRMSDRADSSRFAASSLREAAERARARGDVQGAAQADRMARQQERLARAQGLAGAATGRLSSSMQGLRNSGIGADAAMIGLSFAFMAVFTAMQKASEAAKAVNTIMEARAKADRNAAGEDDPYEGPAQEAYKEITKDFTKEGSGWSAGLNFIGNSIQDLASGTAGIATAGLVGDAKNYLKPFTGETYNEMTGTTGGWKSETITGLGEAQKIFDDNMARINEYMEMGSRTLEDMQEAAAAMPEATPGDDGRITLSPLGEEFKSTSEGILVAAREGSDDIDQAIRDVADNKDLTSQEKVAALASLEQARNLMQEQVNDLLAQTAGIAEASVLGTEQIKRIRETMPLLSGLQSGTNLQMIDQGVQGLLTETGVDENNPTIKNYLDGLAAGGMSDIDVAKGQVEVIRELAKNAELKYISALETGADEDVLNDARSEFTTAMQTLASLTEQQIQTFVGTANAIADSAFALGDFGGSREALQGSIDNLNSLRPKGVTTPGGKLDVGDGTTLRAPSVTTFSAADQEKNYQIDAAVRQQQDRINQQTQFERNSQLQKDAARGQGEVAAARNTLTQAQNNLNVLRQAQAQNGPLGATAQQIHDAEVAVLQGKLGLAQALLSGDVAALALAGAQAWSQAQKDQIAEQTAVLQLQGAIEQYGEGSVQALNAQAGLVNQQHTNQQNADSRAQAARDAALAAIPQGDAVGVANQSVANAQAALAAARKYGTSSVEYQGALAQLYSAQQQAQQAQSAIAVAQAQLAVAYAQARGDAVGAAKASAGVARAQLAAALQASGGATSAEVLGAQAALVAANEAIDDAQVALVQSKINVSIALAEAGGHTVKAARLQIKVALAALNEATQGTAEYNQARADVIRARAAARDAALQDQLDTIDFNLQMGKITQSAAISALRQILRTQDLTKAQRRQLMLQIKGMQDEMADSQWNFGDIRLPTPYQMRRYVKQQQEDMRRAMDPTAAGAARGNGAGQRPGAGLGGAGGGGNTTTQITNNRTTVQIDGADIGQVEKVLKKILGGNARVNRTTGPRRGGG